MIVRLFHFMSVLCNSITLLFLWISQSIMIYMGFRTTAHVYVLTSVEPLRVHANFAWTCLYRCPSHSCVFLSLCLPLSHSVHLSLLFSLPTCNFVSLTGHLINKTLFECFFCMLCVAIYWDVGTCCTYYVSPPGGIL